MNQKKLDDLEKCIELLAAGIPAKDCFTKFPELSPEIREVISTVMVMGNLNADQIPADAMNRSRHELLTKARQIIADEERAGWNQAFLRAVRDVRHAFYAVFSPRPLVGRLIMVVMITGLLILFSRGLVTTSAKSLPGDSLYPIKRAVEDLRVYLVPNREVRHEYEENYSQQRVEEVKSLLLLSRIQPVSFEGILEAKGDTNWIVSGIIVNLQAGTTFVGGGVDGASFEPGSVVEVEGDTNSQGSVTASEIHLRKYQFIGLVQDIRVNRWQISGIQLSITANTQIDDDIRIGDYVTVLVRSEDNGLYALAILHEEHPVETPLLQPLLSAKPTLAEDNGVGMDDEHQMTGTLDEIGDNYLVIAGQIVYFGGDPEISNEFRIGDNITVKYSVEANGSLTVEEIEGNIIDSKLGDIEQQNTPEGESGNEDQGTSLSAPPSEDDDKETPDAPEGHETPEPPEEEPESP